MTHLTTTAAAAAMTLVTFDTPIVRGEITIEKVSVRKPQAGELRGLKLVDVVNVDVNAMIELLPRITLPVLMQPELRTMEVSDFLALADAVASFLPQTGQNSASQAA